MNTRASVAYGWGILCLAGGGAYYFAKRSINSDRADRAMAEERRRQQRERMRVTEEASRDSHLGSSPGSEKASGKADKQRAPNAEKLANGDPAPADQGHNKVSNGAPGPIPESKFEAKQPFRSRKGDRFS